MTLLIAWVLVYGFGLHWSLYPIFLGVWLVHLTAHGVGTRVERKRKPKV